MQQTTNVFWACMVVPPTNFAKVVIHLCGTKVILPTNHNMQVALWSSFKNLK